jgi:hypothetical protein
MHTVAGGGWYGACYDSEGLAYYVSVLLLGRHHTILNASLIVIAKYTCVGAMFSKGCVVVLANSSTI